ncbi:hypothetical protein [Myxococcus sp. AB025B]|uniref:hypothetical protein n=1 Tax=Myxococcus TaxID=32 RepID=UPI0011447794|nr:hypothetical protein [Myxococcus sp. AB025B]
MMNLVDEISSLLREHDISLASGYQRALDVLREEDFTANSDVMLGVNEAMFRHPGALLHRLERHSRNETEGARLIAYVAEHHAEGPLREDLLKHAQDEFRHGRMLGALVDRLSGVEGASPHVEREEHAENAVGFDGNVVGFLCATHVAEIRTFSLLEQYLLLSPRLPNTTGSKVVACFEAIHRDEVRHLVYTARHLNEWMRTNEQPGLILVNYLQSYSRDSWREISEMAGYLARN